MLIEHDLRHLLDQRRMVFVYAGGKINRPGRQRRHIRAVHQSAGAGLTIMAGSGVGVASVPVLAAQGLRAFHASCSAALAAQEEDPLGFAAGRGKQTDAEMVRALKSAIGKACAL